MLLIMFTYLCMAVVPSRVRKSTIAPPFTRVMSILAGFVLSPEAKQRGVSAKLTTINNEYYRKIITKYILVTFLVNQTNDIEVFVSCICLI